MGFKRKIFAFYKEPLFELNNIIDKNYLKPESKIIVTLTTHKKRINTCYLAIESIMNQSIKPKRIILYLDKTIQKIPSTLKRLQKRGLEIVFVKDDLKVYNKIMHNTDLNKKNPILTIDDDIMYPKFMIELILKSNEIKNVICFKSI